MKNSDKASEIAHTDIVNKRQLWDVFAKTGDIEVYGMYLAMKEYEDNSQKAGKENANSRRKS